MRCSARWILLGGAAAVMLPPLGCCLGVAYLERSLHPEKFSGILVDPATAFPRATGLPWERAIRVVRVGESHGGFHGDGESFCILEANQATIDRWLAARPPWGDHDWRTGPVPSEIASHCLLGENSRGWDNPVDPVWKTSRVLYAAKARGPVAMPWHNGNLLVIDRGTGRVWLCIWDF